MKQFFAIKNHITITLVVAIANLSGCGLWHTSEIRQSSFVENEKKKNTRSQYLIKITCLGESVSDKNVSDIIKKTYTKTQQLSLQRRCLLSGDCGILALYANERSLAKKALDESIQIISSVSVAGQTERDATSLHGRESVKRFKGEPYERISIYLHRGLLYLSEADYENAHACFLNASLQEAIYNTKTNRGNWMAIDSLLLFCKRMMKSETADDFARKCDNFYKKETAWTLMNNIPSKPVILLLAVGQGPLKRTASTDKMASSLDYQPIESRVSHVNLVFGSGKHKLAPADDVYILASTMGSRSMDELLDRKVKAGKTIERQGTTAVTIGVIAGSAVPGLNLVGMLMLEAAINESSKIDSSADIRQLYSTPRYYYLVILPKSAIDDAIEIEAVEENGNVLGHGIIKLTEKEGPAIVLARFPY